MNEITTDGQSESHASGDCVRPCADGAVVAEGGTKRHEIEAGSPHALAVGGCHKYLCVKLNM